MKKINNLSILFSLLLCFIYNEEVFARTPLELLDPQDPRQNPRKYCDSNKCTQTVHPLPDSAITDIKKDAEKLYETMDRIGTNEHGLIKMLTSRGLVQRIKLGQAYKKIFRLEITNIKTLEGQLKDELNGAFKNAVLAVYTPLPIFYARELRESITPAGIDEQTLVEILCTVNNFGVKAIADFYKDQFDKSLEEDVIKDKPGSFQKVLVSLIQGKRVEGNNVDKKKAADDAQTLKGPAGKPWKDKPVFVEIFGTRSYPHLREVFIEYKKISGREIEDDIKKEFPEPEARGLLAVAKCIRSKVKFFADRLEEAIKHNKGPSMDRPLIRILVSRSEIDLEDIKIEYEKIYKRSLESIVASKIGGDYRRILTDMIRGSSVPPPGAPPNKPEE